MEMRLDGKVALVTGAFGGLGRDFARMLARAGASVALAGRRIEESPLPSGTQIGAIVRGLPVPGETALGDKRGGAASPEVIIAHHDTMIQTGDRVIIFMPSKKQVREVEKLFQVSATFLG